MKARSGEELACRAREYRFGVGSEQKRRGVLSYYATRALPRAGSLAEWFETTVALISADARTGSLPPFYQPSLQIIGDPETVLPGAPEPIRTPSVEVPETSH